MIETKEKQILQFIKFVPAISTILVSVLITFLIISQKNQNNKTDINNLKKEYLFVNKQRIEQEVNRVYNYINFKKINSEKALKENLKQKVYEAYSIVEGLYLNNKHLSQKELFKLIKNALRNIRFSQGRGYFFIHSLDGTNIFHGTKKELEGTSLWSTKDVQGKYIVQRMVSIIKRAGEGYSEYYWFKPNENKTQYRKIGFYKEFKELNFLIGTAEYLDDFEEEVKNETLSYISSIKYGINGYIFVLDYTGKTISHINKKLINLKYEDIKDKKQKDIVKKFIEIGKIGQGYTSYLGEYNKKRENVTSKISYAKGFDSWQWIIGTGFYQDELLNQIKNKKDELIKRSEKEIVNIIFISSLITFILLLFSIYTSSRLKKHFQEYKEQNKLLTQHLKMATMGEMIANIAHQWRQPLNMISTAASAIKFNKEFNLNDDKKEKESIEHILNSTKHLSQTIDDFKNYFNPNKIKKEFYINNTIEKLFSFANLKFKNKDIKIISKIENINLNSYENELIQAFLNIFNNAYDVFLEKENIDEKYIFIEIKKIKNYKKHSLKNGKYFLEIIIRDNAGGIKEENLLKIFEAYFTTKHQSQGTGIGLYMTYNIIVHNLKGYIEVSNETFTYKKKNYKGANFKIILPNSI